MTPNKQFNKILSWAMLALPIIAIAYFWFVASLFTKSENQSALLPLNDFTPVYISTMTSQWLLVFAYIVHLGKTNRVSNSEKRWWMLGFLFFSLFGMIYYWLKYINPLKFKD